MKGNNCVNLFLVKIQYTKYFEEGETHKMKAMQHIKYALYEIKQKNIHENKRKTLKIQGSLYCILKTINNQTIPCEQAQRG